MDTTLRQCLIIFIGIIACILACLPTLFSQEKNSFANFNPRFEVFTLPGGEVANLVQDIEQDAAGMIWFGTTAGLIRYDGQYFFTYRHDPVNPNSLSSDLVEDIFPDSKGVLWLTHWEGGGLTAFDPEREIFTRYRHDPNPDSYQDNTLSSNTNSVVAEDSQGFIWVGGQEGLDRLDRSTGKFKRFRHDPADPGSLSHNQVRVLYVDKQGTLWVGTGTPWDSDDRQHKLGGLNRYDPASGKFTRYLHNPADPQSIANNKVRAIFEDSKGNFWVGTAGDGLQRLDRKTGKFERLTYDPSKPEKLSRPYLRNLAPAAHAGDSNVTSIMEDQKGRIWITAYPGGLNVFDPATGITRHFEAHAGEGNLTSNYLWKTFQTRDGTTWIAGASFGRAVFKVKQQGDLFPFFSTLSRPEDTTGWSHGILKDRAGNIWRVQDFPNIINAGLPAELQRIDRRTGKKTVIPLGDPERPVQGIWSMSLDREGKIWVGTEQGQFRGDPETGVFQLFQPKGAPPDVLQKLWSPVLHTRSGQFWFGGINHTGVCRYDPKTENFTCYRHDPADPGSLGGDLTWGLYEDARGDVWVGGGDPAGDSHLPIFLDRFNAQTNTFEHFIKEQRQFGMAISITGDKTGNIWFTDARNGFQKLNPATGELKKFTRFNSLLPSQNLHSIMLANDGKLWLSETGSIIAFDPETETMSVFDMRHGVRTANDYFLSGNIAADGELLFSRMGGFHAFYPEQLRREKDMNPPDLRLTGFRLIGVRIVPGSESVLEKPIWQTSHLRLAHDQNVFSFSVACFDFNDPASNQIQFKLENFDRDWRQDLHESETPPYINVPPGSYTFRVRGANSLGAWNMDGVSLKITILPPWWKTWWAYLCYGLLALVAIYFLDREQRRRIVQRERRKMLEKEVAHAKEIEKAYTELKAAQSQLIQSEKLASLGELAAGIAHEIQNPLNFVNNFSELSVDLAEELKLEIEKLEIPEKDKEYVGEILSDLTSNQEKINHHGKRAASIVTGMLQHARTSTGKKEPTDLNGLADEYLRLSYHGLRAKDSTFNAKMVTDFDPAIGKLEVVPQDIGRVFLNIINNAFYATQQRQKQVAEDLLGFKNLTGLDAYEPAVSISSKMENGQVVFKIKDNGTGIPEDVKAKIFQPFFTTKPTGQGTGLGLSLAYDIVVKGHGGTLEVETKERQGTEFIITLPTKTI